jgi:voltage-gated potassium channel
MLGAWVVFVVEYALRLLTAPQTDADGQRAPWRARWRYQRSFLGCVDLAVIVPQALALVADVGADAPRFALVLALLKSARHTRSLPLIVTVLRNEGRALVSGMALMLVLMVLVAAVMYALERAAQPRAFGSIPAAMWWAIVTMATVGYGDVTPVTPLGRLFGGFTMLLGLAMFAIPAGILASGFAAELRKRDFVVTWQTVARVPLFASLDAARIAAIAQMLRPLVLPPGQVVVRQGDAADAMYFIMSGEVEVELPPQPVRLGPGEYFGEIALVRDTRRTATVITLGECRLLALSVEDFRRFVAQNPALKRDIEALAEARLARQTT